MKEKKDTTGNALFDFVGTVDDYVVYVWRGRRCLRRRPKRPEGPPPPGVAAQRERLAACAVFFRALKEVGIYSYWQRAAEGMTMHGYNLLQKANMPAFQADGAIGDFAKLRLTPDLLPLPDDLTLSPEAEGSWRLAWRVAPPLPRAKDDDRVRLLAMRDNETFVLHPLDTGGACRADGEVGFAFPPSARDCSHLFAYFCSRTGEVCSLSMYFTLNLCIYGKI